MNDRAAAAEHIGEASSDATGDAPDLSLNPHLGHLDPDQAEAGKDEAESEKTETVSDDPSDGEENAEIKPDEEPKGIQRRIEELAFENRQLRRQLQQRQQAEPEAPEQSEPLKTLKDFGYDETAFNDYLIDEGAKRAEQRMERRLAANQAESEEQRKSDEFRAREEAYEADNPGFIERLHNPDLPITVEMAQFISDPSSKVGLHVGDYLARNPKEAARIAALSETGQVREMVKLESKVQKEVDKVAAEKSKASKAPEPPKNPVDGTDPGNVLDPANPKDADRMSDEAWFKARERQLEKRRKR